MKKIISILMAFILILGIVGCSEKEKDEDDNKQVVDLMIFMGQSNMAGRGVTSAKFPEDVPELIEGAGYEFRAITDPTKLYPLDEPFGVNENKPGAINDVNADGVNKKTGSLVTAFVNAYYEQTNVPVVAVSASIGGTKVSSWQPGGFYLKDAINRLNAAKEYLNNNDYKIRHTYMVWCQGESDGDVRVPKETYAKQFSNMLNEMVNKGIEKCFMIQIGKNNTPGKYDYYDEIIECQAEIAEKEENVIMVSTLFAGMRDRGLMKDKFHYYQQGYNEVGTDAGTNAAKYVNSLK